MSNDAELREEFNRLDDDKDGFITLIEFKTYYSKHGKGNMNDSEIAKKFADIDSDKDGLVTFEEFSQANKH
ncbi:unnamed protein product [Didymodactylos carnosus]|uniref:EF-hand domain-containing protein n=1 Tax=Didymodactylos carnosus TaxID=1234261 RepID=A0A813R1R4_9BILA|nr:unnamed protein product [Didymodactylos carnosus]CAF1678102.1 unnamed protein product [Didymodactylos carnosus]CAF3556512.1 unnamed protein product [Didymodactylos carnosus]CAF4564775.1 unnamed protein product [Didymodactylos carnosus]